MALSNDMITLDVRHYCATLLHPKYCLLNNCSENERVECHKYISEQLNLIRSTITKIPVDASSNSQQKKLKKGEDFFSRFEDDYPSNNRSTEDDQSGNESEEYDYDIKQSDELDQYLIMDIGLLEITGTTVSIIIKTGSTNSFDTSYFHKCGTPIFCCWIDNQ